MVPKRKKIAMYVAMIIITAIVVFPFLWMVLLSFKSSSEIMSNPLAMPKAFNLDNFKHALETLNKSMFNAEFDAFRFGTNSRGHSL